MGFWWNNERLSIMPSDPSNAFVMRKPLKWKTDHTNKIQDLNEEHLNGPDLRSSRKAELLKGEIEILSAQMETHGFFNWWANLNPFFFCNFVCQWLADTVKEVINLQ